MKKYFLLPLARTICSSLHLTILPVARLLSTMQRFVHLHLAFSGTSASHHSDRPLCFSLHAKAEAKKCLLIIICLAIPIFTTHIRPVTYSYVLLEILVSMCSSTAWICELHIRLQDCQCFVLISSS